MTCPPFNFTVVQLEDENSQVSLPGAICGSVVPEVTSNMSLLKMEQGTSSSNGVHKHDKKGILWIQDLVCI